MIKGTANKIYVEAYDSTDGSKKTGDAANLTAHISKDGGADAALTDTSATEIDATNMPGLYVFDISDTETNADVIAISCLSTTSNIVCHDQVIYTSTPMRGTDSALLAASAPTNFGDMAITATTGRVDVNVNNDKDDYTISGTIDTLDGLNDVSAADVNAACDTALSDYDAPTNAEMEARTIAADDYFDPANDTVATVTTVGTVTNSVTVGAMDDAALIDMVSNDTGETSAAAGSVAKLAQGEGASLTVADIADGVWDEVQSGHVDAGTFGKYLDAQITGVGGAAGAGADQVTITITVSGSALPDASVWCTSDEAGAVVIAGTLVTDSNGQVEFLLDAGNTYYLWATKAGYVLPQGESFVAVAD